MLKSENAAILIFILCSAAANLAEPGTKPSIRWGALVIICMEPVEDQ
jgi:hypothetical protein